ncbi:isopropylmalate isomerase [Alkalispirochaeta odontotermitis]|nr:isopropylmalate isomerase [Alkalispirochaeta odontotermitis]CAB1082607.1 3-isopropylmalate dehydratase small subunit (EC [Olavius algarvensis Delta 1 endosymbiont]
MKAFKRHTGKVATLNRSNVDTDAIIPKQFLKSISRDGYGPNAFFDWRYKPDGSPDPDFELNHPRFTGRSILVTRNNFGCGSSREHAVWALSQDGYAVIIAPWKEINGVRVNAFADIFKTNSVKNGVLAIELSEEEVGVIFDYLEGHEELRATADLVEQRLVLDDAAKTTFSFTIEPGDKEQLLSGLDDIDLTLKYESDITRFEANHDPYLTRD